MSRGYHGPLMSDTPNSAFRQLPFMGVIRVNNEAMKVGWKMGGWRDVGWWQRLL